MIVDSHIHIFPPMGSASGHKSPRHHLRFVQRELATNDRLPIRTALDAQVTQSQPLIQDNNYTFDGLVDRDFRSGGYGRLMWTSEGQDVYKQYLPPSMVNLEALPGVMVATMNHSGVDKAVIHNGHLYGKLNEYQAKAIQTYPGRFWGLAVVDEWKAYHRSQLEVLEHAIKNLGLHGTWFDTRNIFFGRNNHKVEDRVFDTFFDLTKSLKTPVFWNCPSNEPSKNSYLSTIRSLGKWLQKNPTIPCVLTNGFPFGFFTSKRGVVFPQEFWDVLKAPNLMVELCFPIIFGGLLDYPYRELRPIIRQFYKHLGPDKLVWGTDAPNVERFCTYKQSLDYLKDYCSFIPDRHMDMILGNNLARLFEHS